MRTANIETDLPTSVLTKSQKRTYGPRLLKSGEVIIAEVRHDDECGNGHNSFSITASIHGGTVKSPGAWHSGGRCHDEVAEAFPELAPFIKWHLMGTDQPMHYVANTIYHAGDRDCWGLRKGEFRQHTSRGPNQNGGVEGVPKWVLELPERSAQDVYSQDKPAPVVCEWKAYGRTGEGKERDLNAARACAVWPDATDEQLCAEPEELKAALLARLPVLMAQFKADVESLGFVY